MPAKEIVPFFSSLICGVFREDKFHKKAPSHEGAREIHGVDTPGEITF